MQHLDIILILMALLAILYSFAEKLRISYPILLVLAGLAISVVPGLPVVKLSPEVAFLIFLPPLLFDAARNTSWHEFKTNRAVIGRLAIGLVLFSTASVAVCAYYLIPGFTWPLAFALGAIVSPPDAVAATSAIKGYNLPKRLVSILEGESLVNDASALVAYRYAITAVLSGTFVLWSAALQFMLVAVGGIATGFILGHLFLFLQRKILRHATVETVMTLLLPFAAYIIAEKIHVSGVLSAVTAGLFISWRAHEIFSARTRIQMNNFWETLVFLLNGLVFILIGLQLPEIITTTPEHEFMEMVHYGLIVSATVIIARLIWIFPAAYAAQFYDKWRNGNVFKNDPRHLLVLGWAGMRGVVSLATALAIPLTLDNGHPFPERNTILFITFTVILVTLVFQGLTLPLMIRWLGVCETKDRILETERRLRLELSNGAHHYIEKNLAGAIHETALDGVKNRLMRQIAYLNGILKTNEAAPDTIEEQTQLFNDYLKAESEIIEHQRRMIIEMHKKGTYEDELLRKVESDLDARHLTLDSRRTPE